MIMNEFLDKQNFEPEKTLDLKKGKLNYFGMIYRVTKTLAITRMKDDTQNPFSFV